MLSHHLAVHTFISPLATIIIQLLNTYSKAAMKKTTFLFEFLLHMLKKIIHVCYTNW